MATLDQLKTHIVKAKTQSAEAVKKSETPKADPAVKQTLKKVKRLQRKSAKIIATAAMVEEKKKPKKERKSAAKD